MDEFIHTFIAPLHYINVYHLDSMEGFSHLGLELKDIKQSDQCCTSSAAVFTWQFNAGPPTNFSFIIP